MRGRVHDAYLSGIVLAVHHETIHERRSLVVGYVEGQPDQKEDRDVGTQRHMEIYKFGQSDQCNTLRPVR
jgi:hypothetical protein